MRALRNDCYWWANIYKNFKLALNSIPLTPREYDKEIMRFLDKFEERFLYRRILNDGELHDLHTYIDNVVIKYKGASEGIDEDCFWFI
jgi:hypothetical protein